MSEVEPPRRLTPDDVRARARADVERRNHRAPANRFWAAVALTGSVGWPIVLLAGAGVLLGRWLDHHYESGVRFTLMLLVVGTGVGTAMAFRAVRGDP